MRLNNSFLLLLVLTLSACSSSSSICKVSWVISCKPSSEPNSENSDYVSYVPTTPTTYSDAKQQGLAQINFMTRSDVIRASDVPSGTFVYNGFAAFADGKVPPEDYSQYGLVSNLTLNANFNNGSLTGTMHNFQNSNGSLSGTVNINGNITGSDLSATTSGVLSQGNATIQNAGNMSGMFFDKGSSDVIGVGGTMAGKSGTSDYVGIFTAQR